MTKTTMSEELAPCYDEDMEVPVSLQLEGDDKTGEIFADPVAWLSEVTEKALEYDLSLSAELIERIAYILKEAKY
jgi:hypothetical protein